MWNRNLRTEICVKRLNADTNNSIEWFDSSIKIKNKQEQFKEFNGFLIIARGEHHPLIVYVSTRY